MNTKNIPLIQLTTEPDSSSQKPEDSNKYEFPLERYRYCDHIRDEPDNNFTNLLQTAHPIPSTYSETDNTQKTEDLASEKQQNIFILAWENEKQSLLETIS